MHRPRLLLLLLVLALAACDEAKSPTEPTSMSQAGVAAATALAFWQVSAGGDHTCGLTTDYRAYCWGLNNEGQLGDSTITSRWWPTPVAVRTTLRFRQISAGAEHTCAVTTEHRLYCWGSNHSGQLGNNLAPGLTPVLVSGGHTFRQVSAGGGHSCGVTTENRAYCWGNGLDAQLGDGTARLRFTPVPVIGDLRFQEVSAGNRHTCGLSADNRAYCWGSNRLGQVGDSTDVGKRFRPRLVAGGHLFRQLDTGWFDYTCAVTTTYRAYCWGDGRYGQLGNGKTYLSFWPRAVAGGLSFGRVTAGGHNTCGETTTNRAYCWGENVGGDIGDGTTTQRLRPVAVAGGFSFTQLSAGGFHTCGKTPEGVGYCWGANAFGQLGDGSFTGRLTPTPVAGPS
jgi:alpha-tubulin suppressor-like RCC1 family protein